MAHFVYDPNIEGDNSKDATFESTSINWTTKDENKFVHEMYEHGNLNGLRNYEQIVQFGYRRYFGEGLFVDWELIAVTLRALIESLQEKKGDYR